jgi:DNA-binding NarL/FixJ family response regulator
MRSMDFTVMVVDDHPGFRASARRLLESEGLLVVGDAKDGASALVAVRALKPQLAIVDVHLPDIDGFELAARIAELDGAPAVILISSHDRAELEPFLPGSGALGFVQKSELSREALEALM